MAVPAHDSRDYAFAKHFGLEIRPLVEGCDVSEESFDAKEGIVCNSPRAGVTPYCDLSLNGLTIKEAIAATKKYVKGSRSGTCEDKLPLARRYFQPPALLGRTVPGILRRRWHASDVAGRMSAPVAAGVDKFLPTETGEPPLGHAVKWAWDTVNRKSHRGIEDR